MAGNLLTQIFDREIQEGLWDANEFMSHAIDDTSWVNADQVNLPVAGAPPGVVKDRSAKADSAKRTDGATKYNMHELSTDPTWVQVSEELTVNYNKRQSVLRGHKKALIDALAVNVLHEWAAGGDDTGSIKPVQVRTSGTGRPVGLETVGSTAPTGNRKGLAYADVLDVIAVFNKQNIPSDGRYAVITAEMLKDLQKIEEFKNSDYYDKKTVEKAPRSFYWLGITWYVRSFVTMFSNAATPVLKDVGADTATTSNAGAIFWHKDHVRKANGAVKTFLNLNQAEEYGDIMSALLRYGAFGARKDGKGIVNLVESAVA